MGASIQQRARDDEDRCQAFGFCGVMILILLPFAVAMYVVSTEKPPPWHSVAIGAVSGLDPATDLQEGHGLNPAFNLTVRIDASLSGNSKAAYCLDKSTSVQVSYLRVPLAGGRVPEPGNDTCAAPGSRKDLAVVARGRGVAVPGFLLDNLVEDMQRGEAVFEVTLMSPDDGGWNVMTCWGKPGDDATLEAPCTKSWVKAGLPVPQPGGSGGGYVPLPQQGRRSRKVVHVVVAEEENGSPASAGTYATI